MDVQVCILYVYLGFLDMFLRKDKIGLCGSVIDDYSVIFYSDWIIFVM